MPRTPPTMVAPLPRDPRVMVMAKTLNVSRADAFTAVADVWAMLAADAEGDIVKGWTLEMLDAVVELPMAGCGAVMLQAGLVGVVDDGLVLPAELRHQQREERGGPAAVAEVRGGDGRDERRKEQNRAASRKYRKKTKVTGSKAKSTVEKKFRSLGRVAGHEVRVFEGQYGPYVMVLGATVNGTPFKKFTTGDKSWSLDTVTLVDALPGLVEKWKEQSRPRGLETTGPTLVPSYADFRDDAERLTVLAKYQSAAEADAARHADGDDASARHADASATSAGPSAGPNDGGERKSASDTGLDAAAASADRHADGVSSSYPSKSSSNEEEDMGTEGRKAAADHEPDRGATEPEGYREWEAKRAKGKQLAARIAEALGMDIDTVLYRGRTNPHYLALQCREAGIDPRTGYPVTAGAPDEPAGARADIPAITEPTETDKPAGGNVGARGDGTDDANREPPEFAFPHEDIRRGLQQQGVPLPTVKTPPADNDCAYVNGVSVGA